jgi:uncharacterized protein (TIGR02996 family)
MSASSLRRALEDELVANPDDLATHAAYADLLGEQGNRRGEFIQVQMALEDPDLEPDRRRELQAREMDLLAAHGDEWLGPLGPLLLGQDGVNLNFRRGWLDALEIQTLSLPQARALRDAPQARLLRHLGVEQGRDDEPTQPDDEVPEDEAESHPGFWPLVGSPAVANLRSFRIGVDEGDDYNDFRCWLYTTVVVPLVRTMPRLEELYVYAKDYSLTDLWTLPTLRRLRVMKLYHASQLHRLDVLAANPAFEHLTHLLLHPHHFEWLSDEDRAAGFREGEGYIPLRLVVPLFRSPHLRHLTHLQLRLSSMGDDGCQELVGSGLLKRLKSLDLRHGRITDAGARLLANCPEVAKLQWLDLSANSLSDEGVALIRSLGVSCSVDGQHDPAEAERMTGEETYLTEGDFE